MRVLDDAEAGAKSSGDCTNFNAANNVGNGIEGRGAKLKQLCMGLRPIGHARQHLTLAGRQRPEGTLDLNPCWR